MKKFSMLLKRCNGHIQRISVTFFDIVDIYLKKIVISYLVAYIESSGILKLMVEKEIFGPTVINSVMKYGNYIRDKGEISSIAEVMQQLQVKGFSRCDGVTFCELFEKVD